MLHSEALRILVELREATAQAALTLDRGFAVGAYTALDPDPEGITLRWQREAEVRVLRRLHQLADVDEQIGRSEVTHTLDEEHPRPRAMTRAIHSPTCTFDRPCMGECNALWDWAPCIACGIWQDHLDEDDALCASCGDTLDDL